MAEKTGYIGRNPGDSSVTIARQTYTPTSNTTEFSFTSGYTVGLCDVYLNGVKLVDARDYDANTGSTVGLTSAATSGDIVEIIAYKAFNLGNVTDASGNFTVGSTLSVGSTATLSGVTTCEGDLYVGGDLYVLDDIVYDEVTGRNLNITGIASAAVIHAGAGATVLSSGNAEFVGIVTSNTCFKVGNGAFGAGIGATITGDGNAVFAGVVTATTFKGDGSALTGVAATDYVVSNTLKVLGISTFSGEVQVGTAVTIGVAGVTTFSNGVHLDGTTVFGKGNAVLLENGFENENAQIINDGATEKATIVFKTSSGGTVSERLRIKDTGDVDLSGSAAGVSSVTWDASADSLIFKDKSYAKFGDSSDLSIYHDSSSSYIKDSGTGGLFIQGSGGGAGITLEDPDGNNFVVCIDEGTGGTVELYKSGNKKLETTTDGITVTGKVTATNYAGDGSALTGVGGEFDITSCLFI